MAQTATIAGRELRLTNQDKVMYPATGTTKGAVIEYYLAIAPVLLPLARGRPVTRKRWVHGVGTAADPGKFFFRKDLEEGAPDWLPRVTYQHKTTTNTYPLAEEPAALAWFGQLAALELHVPQWRFDDDGARLSPDRLVLDLDPGKGAGLAECVEVALLCKEFLDDMELAAVPVTSGSKGIHLYAALDGTLTSDDASSVAKKLAEAIEQERPDLATANMRKELRRGKVLIDWSQNNAAKTTICPFSLRGRPRPMVAAPRTWEELQEPGLKQLSYRQVLKRVEDGINPMEVFAASPPRGRGRGRRASKARSAKGGGERSDGEDGDGAQDPALARYRAKRDTQRTPEPFPRGEPERSDKPIFVIQRHDARRLHWDLRLERGGVLASWAVPKGPPLDVKENRLAVQTEDHPREYASFAGEIPAGEYGGGTVEIWDAGTIEIEKWEEGKEVIAVLYPEPGGGLGGVPRRYALIHTGAKDDDRAPNWLLHLMKDQPRPTSLPAPRLPRPMLATAADAHRAAELEAGEWGYEMKWDGIRALAAIGEGEVRLASRRGHDITAMYPELGELASLAAPGVVVDGEIVALSDRGVPSFGALQKRMNLASREKIAAEQARTPVYYMVFDVLASAEGPMTAAPYEQRRKELFELVRRGHNIFLPAAESEDLAAAMAASSKLGLEGVVAKRKSSPYLPGERSQEWLKVKHERHQEVIIVGWRPNAHGNLASLVLAIPGEGGLTYAGRVGTGFSEKERVQIPRELRALSREQAPVTGVPRDVARDAKWVDPTRVGEVRFTERTGHGSLRHPTWRGWRPDKSARDVRREDPEI